MPPPRSLPGDGEATQAVPPADGPHPPPADRLPPRDPAAFDAWFDDEPVRPLDPPEGPTPAAPGYPAGFPEPGAGGGYASGATGYPGQAGYPASGSGYVPPTSGYGDNPGLGDGFGGTPSPGAGAASPGYPGSGYEDPSFPTAAPTPPPVPPTVPGGPGSAADPADEDDRGVAGLPTRAGRRSLIGAFGPPPEVQPPMASEGFTQPPEGDAGDQTMTTRVSIKIPGSRPIPPVVLRGQAPMGREDEGYSGYDERGFADGSGAAAGAAGPIRGWDDVDDHEFGSETPPDGVPGGTAPPGGRQESGRRTPAPPPSPKRKRRRLAIVATAATFALLGGIYGGSLAYAGGGVPRGTSVLGVDIGGQSKAEAVRTLERGLSERATGKFKVMLGSKELELDPPNAGLILDARGTVDRAAQKTLNPLKSVPAMFGGTREVKPRTIEDPAKLAAALEQLAADAGEEQREGGVSFAGGKAAAIAPQAVQVLDTSAAVAAVRDAYLNPAKSGPVVLPTKLSTPKVSQEEVDRAMREFAMPAMSGPVTLTAGKVSLKLEPAILAKYLSMQPDANGRLTPKIDTAGLQDALGNTFSAVGQKPVDATFKVENGKVVVVPHKAGQGVSGATAADALLGVLTKPTARTAAVTLGPVDPEFTTAKAEALGIKEVMATYTTEYPYAAYRLTNIHRAADLIDGGIVMPGDTWSLNKTVGERTAENGFAKGTIINNGRFQTDFGGGVSQVATTMFNAVFFAGLKDVMHKPHSFWIDRYPAGREATVAWPSLDLRWQNDSGKPVFIDTSYTNSTITVTLLGTKKFDEIKSVSSAKYDTVAPKAVNDPTPGCVAQAPSQGFKIDVTRVFIQDGKEVRRERFHTKYDAADNITCNPAAPGGPPAPPTPPAGGGTSD